MKLYYEIHFTERIRDVCYREFPKCKQNNTKCKQENVPLKIQQPIIKHAGTARNKLFERKHKPRMSLSENTNKENIPIAVNETEPLYPKINNNHHHQNKELIKLQRDVTKLERLYKDEVIKCQQSMSEQERLEIEMLQKEKQIYQQQQHLQKMTDLNKSLSKKLSVEISYYENALGNYRKMEKEWDDKFRKSKIDQTKFEHMIKKKNDELNDINQELEIVKNQVDNKDLELKDLKVQLEQTLEQLEEMKLKNLLHHSHHHDKEKEHEHKKIHDNDSSDEEDLSSLVIHDDEEEDEETGDETFDISGNSSSLAHEINNKINDNDKTIKKYQFEVKSLKNEKHQLYNYINKLLKNKPHPDQNSVLKEKLVKRKILRTISINQAVHGVSDNASIGSTKSNVVKAGKRVLSNVVNFKSYQNLKKRPSQQISATTTLVHEQNSDTEQETPQQHRFTDDEDVDEDEIRLIGNQNFACTIYKLSSPYFMMNPIELLLKVKKQEEQLDKRDELPKPTDDAYDNEQTDKTIELGAIELDID